MRIENIESHQQVSQDEELKVVFKYTAADKAHVRWLMCAPDCQIDGNVTRAK